MNWWLAAGGLYVIALTMIFAFLKTASLRDRIAEEEDGRVPPPLGNAKPAEIFSHKRSVQHGRLALQ